jgi:hypothetical protein
LTKVHSLTIGFIFGFLVAGAISLMIMPRLIATIARAKSAEATSRYRKQTIELLSGITKEPQQAYVYNYKDGTRLQFVNGVPDTSLHMFYYKRLKWQKFKGKFIQIWLIPKNIIGDKVTAFTISEDLSTNLNGVKIVVPIDPDSRIDPCSQADDGIIAGLKQLGENEVVSWPRDLYGIVVDNMNGNEP